MRVFFIDTRVIFLLRIIKSRGNVCLFHWDFLLGSSQVQHSITIISVPFGALFYVYILKRSFPMGSTDNAAASAAAKVSTNANTGFGNNPGGEFATTSTPSGSAAPSVLAAQMRSVMCFKSQAHLPVMTSWRRLKIPPIVRCSQGSSVPRNRWVATSSEMV